MKLLDMKRIKGINHIVFLKNGAWYGFGRESAAKKFIRESGDSFSKWYSWASDGFFFHTPAYYLNEQTKGN